METCGTAIRLYFGALPDNRTFMRLLERLTIATYCWILLKRYSTSREKTPTRALLKERSIVIPLPPSIVG